MKHFAHLFSTLDETTKTSAKVAAMAEYFAHADAADGAWAVWFLSGHRPKRLIPVRRLAAWAMEIADVPTWMFEECYAAGAPRDSVRRGFREVSRRAGDRFPGPRA